MPSDDHSPTPGHGAPATSRGVRAFLRRLRRSQKSDSASPEATAAAAAVAANGGGVDIVDQAAAFKMLRVEDVMTPRADIVACDIATPFEGVVRQFAEVEHSRMPVYRDTLDDPVGVVHIKDVFKLLAGEGRAPAPGDPILHRLRREVLYVPASMRAADLLLRMQAARIHLALVIDEFGGTDGLVTLEDLLEAVVGEIEDEYDEAAPAQVISRPGGVIEADARAPLEDLESVLEVSLAPEDLEEEIDTVAGLVSALAGRVPQRGEVIAHPHGFDFEITDADPRRVKHVRIRRVDRPKPGEPLDGAASS
jgi:CBS domain containing-hemolysin-like protein